MSIDSKLIQTIPYFSSLKIIELEDIKQLCIEKNLSRGEMIFLEGETAEALFFVINGVVKIFKTSSQGKEQIIKIAVPPNVLNDASLFDGGPNSVSAQTMTAVTLYSIKQDNLELLIKRYPQIGFNIIKSLSENTRYLLSLIEDLSFKHVIGRVGKILLKHIADGDGKQRLTQQEMAAMAGTAREVVARSLKTLEDRGMVKVERHRIHITNKLALEDLISDSA